MPCFNLDVDEHEKMKCFPFSGRRDGSDDVHVPDGDGGLRAGGGVALWRPRGVVHREGLARGSRLFQGREQHRLPRRGVDTGEMDGVCESTG